MLSFALSPHYCKTDVTSSRIMKVVCSHCQTETEKPTGAVNRALKSGLPIYCNRTCAGLARRIGRSIEEKKQLKFEYDKKYREQNKEQLKVKKNEYHKKTYDPEKASVKRKANMHKHIEIMRRPKWVAYKQQYDKKYLAKKKYGEFWESAILINEIQSLYDDKEIRQINNLHNKSQKRKRKWQQKIK